MTVIAAAVTKKDGVVIVGDSELSGDFTKDTDGYSKIWVSESQGYIFGACGSLRVMQVIKHWTNWPYYRSDITDLEEFMVKDVVPNVREALFEHGALEVNKKTENFEGDVIMAWDNNLVVIDGGFSVLIPVSGRYAIGSGLSEAMGRLGNTGPYTKQDVVEAARRATITAVGVGGPLWAVSTKTMKVEQL